MIQELQTIVENHPAVFGVGLAALIVGLKQLLPQKRLSAIELSAAHEQLRPEAGFFPKSLLTANELHFYKRLQAAVGPGRTVLTQVGLGALIDSTLPEGNPNREFERRKFISKLLDFVVIDNKTAEVLVVVELDDRTHDKLKDHYRDHFLLQAGFRTLRYESRAKPSVDALKIDIKSIAS